MLSCLSDLRTGYLRRVLRVESKSFLNYLLLHSSFYLGRVNRLVCSGEHKTGVSLNCLPVNCKGNQSWIFIGRTHAEAPMLWPPDVKTDSLEKILMLGKIEGRRRRGWQRMRWHHQLDGHEFEQALGVGEGQGSLACGSPWSHKESDRAERLNWTELSDLIPIIKFF